MEDKLMEIFKGMEDGELISIWNNYIYAIKYYDDEIFDMEMFNEIYANTEPDEIARRVFYGHDEWSDESAFNPNRNYFYFNGYGNPVSVDYIGYNEYADKFMLDWLDINGLIEYIIRNNESFDNDEIMEVLEDV